MSRFSNHTTNDMPVQMYGAVSGHKLGYLNQAIQIPANATAVGMLPTFAVDIPCAREIPALCWSVDWYQPAVPEWQQKYMSPAFMSRVFQVRDARGTYGWAAA